MTFNTKIDKVKKTKLKLHYNRKYKEDICNKSQKYHTENFTSYLFIPN